MNREQSTTGVDEKDLSYWLNVAITATSQDVIIEAWQQVLAMAPVLPTPMGTVILAQDPRDELYWTVYVMSEGYKGVHFSTQGLYTSYGTGTIPPSAQCISTEWRNRVCPVLLQIYDFLLAYPQTPEHLREAMRSSANLRPYLEGPVLKQRWLKGDHAQD